MNSSEALNNPILKQSNEHKLIFDYVTRFDRLLADNNTDELTSLTVALGRMMEKDMESHFQLEEKVFFPALLVGDPSWENTQAVTDLLIEHGTLRRDMAEVVRLVRLKLEKSSRVDADLARRILPLISGLKEHARKEILHIFPAINDSERCLELVGEYTAKVGGRKGEYELNGSPPARRNRY